MARKALIIKAQRIPKYSTRKVNRCRVENCGRARFVFRDYLLCRLHFREYVYKGLLPGFKKAS